ncbi:MAG TPA: helix-turn-helix transcriptional regulator [Sphingomonadales bacterium]
MKTRIRELRKQKGLTLQELGERVRPPTTAQTIGRLETGQRKLTLDWLDKIAEALDVAPMELIDLGGETEIPLVGVLADGGRVAPAGAEALRLSPAGSAPLALKVAAKVYEFEVGDTVICEPAEAPEFADALGKECYIVTRGGERLFGRLIRGSAPGRFTVIPASEGSAVLYDVEVAQAARRSMLVRYY